MTHLSPRVLAEAIGVSESSLKRWADEGRLAAERTAGGHRRIPVSEALRFIRHSGLTLVRPDLLGLPGEPVAMGRSREAAAERLEGLLMEDRADAARSLLVSLYVDGASLSWICDEVIRVVLARLGELWEHGPSGIFLEHRATETCLRSLAQLRLLLPPVPSDAPAAVGGAFEGDDYQIPSAMAALILAEAGYRARDLGPRTPVAATLEAVARYGPGLIWQSISVEPADPVRAIRDLARLAKVVSPGALVVGGRAGETVAVHGPNVHRLGSMAELAAFGRGAASRLTGARSSGRRGRS
jgi:MerR family transcriptional regulator, light-induced transcriptional regulator